MTTQSLVVLCSCPDETTADKLAEAVVDARSAACVNIVPQVTSVYRWQGERMTDREALLIIKTTTAAYPEVEATLLAHHPYELPEIIALPIAGGLSAYLDWVDKSCSGEVP